MTDIDPIEYRRFHLELFNEEELGEFIGVKPNTLQNWRVAGKGPVYVKLGKDVFYQLADIKEWIRQSRYTPVPANKLQEAA